MKWFKHISDSLDDPFIFDLIDQFGGDGYLVFFGTLEVMSREFDVNLPGFCRISDKFLAKKLQISVKKLSKLLNFCTKNGRIMAEFKGGYIELNCPKLVELTDEYTQRLIGKNVGTQSGATPPEPEQFYPLEGEEEVEVYSVNLKNFVTTFYSNLKKTNPNQYPKSDKLIENSLKTLKQLTDINNYTEDYIFKAIKWALLDDFWSGQIFSLAALRKKSKNGLIKFQNLSSQFDLDTKNKKPKKIKIPTTL